MTEPLIDAMKKGIKENPNTKKILQEMIDEGIKEELALDLMIYAWIQHDRWKEQ